MTVSPATYFHCPVTSLMAALSLSHGATNALQAWGTRLQTPLKTQPTISGDSCRPIMLLLRATPPFLTFCRHHARWANKCALRSKYAPRQQVSKPCQFLKQLPPEKQTERKMTRARMRMMRMTMSHIFLCCHHILRRSATPAHHILW